MITKPGGITISEGYTRCIPMVFLNPAPGQELENAHYFEKMNMGKIAKTPEEAIDIVTQITNDETLLNKMTSNMKESRIEYSTLKLCKDLLELLGHSSQPEEIYGKVPLYARFLVK